MSEAAICVLTALLDSKQVAELLHVPTSWVYAQAESGALPSLKIGKYRRFRREQIEEWAIAQEGK